MQSDNEKTICLINKSESNLEQQSLVDVNNWGHDFPIPCPNPETNDSKPNILDFSCDQQSLENGLSSWWQTSFEIFLYT